MAWRTARPPVVVFFCVFCFWRMWGDVLGGGEKKVERGVRKKSDLFFVPPKEKKKVEKQKRVFFSPVRSLDAIEEK